LTLSLEYVIAQYFTDIWCHLGADKPALFVESCSSGKILCERFMREIQVCQGGVVADWRDLPAIMREILKRDGFFPEKPCHLFEMCYCQDMRP
jgi:hypothetical protein